ncbi:MAG: glutathione S-transferase family protein [Endozoicomonas sp.]
MSLPGLELISFKTCPFVQRSVITLLEKGIEFKLTFIDLSDKPDWFLAISPLGKVPLLRVGEELLFESAVINEFLDEITPPSLHPTEPLVKAQHRAWIEFGSTVIMTYYRMTMAKQGDTYKALREDLGSQLKKLESQVEGPLFAGDRMSLVDTAMASVLMRIDLLEQLGMPSLLSAFPVVKAWSRSLLSRSSVQQSVVDNFRDLSVESLIKSDSYLSHQLNL